MNPDQQKLKDLKEKIHELQEYLLSDCCKTCRLIIDTINEYEQEIAILLKNQE